MSVGDWLDVSVVSSSSGLSVVVLSSGVFAEHKLSVVVDVLLFDWVDGHAYVNHEVILARWDGVGALVVETIVGIEVHEGVSESYL